MNNFKLDDSASQNSVDSTVPPVREASFTFATCMALAVRYSLRLEEWAYALLYYGPQTRGSWQTAGLSPLGGWDYLLRVERVRPLKSVRMLGSNREWRKRSQFQEEESVLGETLGRD
jgi:hypothetical protein